MLMRMRRCDGFALLSVLTAMVLMSALAAALILVSSSERLIAATYRTSVEAFYAADAMAERAIADLDAMSDWSVASNGLAHSSFVDGPPDGPRPIAGGLLDLGQAVNFANCGKAVRSSEDLFDNATGDRPWGTNNPVWQLFGYGPLNGISSAGTIASGFYVLALVAGSPASHGSDPVGTLLVRAEAFGPRSSHKVIELRIARRFAALHDADDSSAPGRHLRVLTWHEIK